MHKFFVDGDPEGSEILDTYAKSMAARGLFIPDGPTPTTVWRLAPGVSLEQAGAVLDELAAAEYVRIMTGDA